tara:strand:- start:1200 stop:1799 length:600 start_codon:yes stop_codon:yes gene_type:complete
MAQTKSHSLKGMSMSERKAWRRKQLLEAAIQTYGQKGFDQTTVKDVCLSAGLTERYFYESFTNRDELLMAAFEQVSDALFQQITEIESNGASKEQLINAMLKTYFKGHLDFPQGAKLFACEMQSHRNKEGVETIYQEFLNRYGVLMAKILKLEKRNKVLEYGILGGVLEITRFWINEDFKTDIDEIVPTAAKLFEVLTD